MTRLVTRTAHRVRGERIFGQFDAGAPRSVPADGNRGEASPSTVTRIDASLAIMSARSFSTAVSRIRVGGMRGFAQVVSGPVLARCLRSST